MNRTPSQFKVLASENVADQRLRHTFQSATHHALGQRSQAVQLVPEWEDLRERAHRIKEEAINHLDLYVERLEASVTQRGGRVFWARDAGEASNYVVDLCRRLRASTVVKSKSMAAEEIGLSDALEAAGVKPVETDLGEFIIQAAGETPSHIIAPALHMTRQQVGDLFHKTFGIPYTDIPAELCAFARQKLRREFLSARLGISGVNFAAADTGTIVVVENEGNARLCTSLPRVHLAIMGLEKVIPSFSDLPLFLRLLARSSTGQKQTSYVSMISGPRREGEWDGPEEFHLILLDNGRTDILADPRVRQSLFCIRCGACLNTCPVYQRVGGHSYGSVYSGPIGSVLTPLFQGLEAAQDLPYASSLCGSCSDICPVKIDLHHQLLWLREKLVARRATPWRERLAMALYAAGMKDPALYRMGSAVLRLLLKLGGKSGRHLAIPGWSSTRDFPALAETSFKQWWEENRRQGELP